ncbi:2-deoxy-D-gluconate 3-dehydrogenase (KduD) [Desulfamplus magnetovallimortis]|uniref:2-deoxy-D-gluconate 3-dehydrogenase (KduD) n=1 Tax=Desulfamplus magnetovallimortis TaxID=1246637 RepID=A0A1W1HH01_9BACT|nr:glucose 1-dehydrogenase [Desulfamplus magnetovallimortis]SLM31703.1 2-deoxy-D-gluconate 3-dehydrogenase (KduD) [Desulfamplus magnetovallimortis]
MKDIFKLSGKIAVVTGGAGGIGEALALGLGVHGATVIVSSRNKDAIEAVAAKITKESGNEAIAIPCDVTSEASMADLVDVVVKKYGRIDILVNAMGMNIKHDAFEYPVEDWEKLFNVNVKGTMIACKAVGRVMKEQKCGSIINLSSVRGIRGYSGGNSGYCATKGAVELVTKALAIEWAPLNIRVNAIGPALIITPGTKHIADNPELAKKYAAAVPMGRIGLPEDLAGACVFLASDAAGFISGQTIFVDGGLTAQ